MSCSCDWDAPRVYVQTKPVARRPHVCSECGTRIAKGEAYERTFGVWDGMADTFKTCERCVALREYVVAHIPCSCWTHGNMIEEIMEEADHWSREAPGLLFGAWRRRVAISRGHSMHIGRALGLKDAK